MCGMSAHDAARLDAWITREPPEPDFDCECDTDHDDCDGCDCIGHNPGCSLCHASHGCYCDDLYESYKDRMLDEELAPQEPDYDY